MAEAQRNLNIIQVFKMNSAEQRGLLSLPELRTALEELELTCHDEEMDAKAAEELMKDGGSVCFMAEDEEEEGEAVQRMALLEFDVLIHNLLEHLDAANQVSLFGGSPESILVDVWRQLYPGVVQAPDKDSMINQFVAASDIAENESGGENTSMLAAQEAVVAQKEGEKKLVEHQMAETAREKAEADAELKRGRDEIVKIKEAYERKIQEAKDSQNKKDEGKQKEIANLKQSLEQKGNECSLKEQEKARLEHQTRELKTQNQGLSEEIGVMKHDLVVSRMQLRKQAERMASLKLDIRRFGQHDDYEGNHNPTALYQCALLTPTPTLQVRSC